MEFFDVIEKRVSVRSYQSKEIEKEKLEKLIWTMQQAPSAGDLKSWGVVMVPEKEIKEKITTLCCDQKFLSECSIILVFLADTVASAKKYGDRGAGFYCLQDATIAAAYAQLAATELGLATCWVGAFQADKIMELLKLQPHLCPIAVMALGYAK